MTTTDKAPSFVRLVDTYLRTLKAYREAKTAVNVAERLGQSAHDLRFHAAQLHVRHQQAMAALVERAVQMREAGHA